MFDVGSSELLFIIVVAILVIGPKELPRTLYKLGQVIGKARGMARHFRTGFDAMIREAELEELQKQWAQQNQKIMDESRVAELESDTHVSTDGTVEASSADTSSDTGSTPALLSETPTTELLVAEASPEDSTVSKEPVEHRPSRTVLASAQAVEPAENSALIESILTGNVPASAIPAQDLGHGQSSLPLETPTDPKSTQS